MQLDRTVWQIVVDGKSEVPLSILNTTMKKPTNKIAELEAYATSFRRIRLQRWAVYLDDKIKRSGVVANQSQIETATAKFGKKFAGSRQRMAQMLQAKNPDTFLRDLSLPRIETVLGIAEALGLPYEQALEAAGYRTDLDSSFAAGASSEMAALFGQMSKEQQELTLSIAQSILATPKNDKALTLDDEQKDVLDWYDQLDPVTKAVLLPRLRAGGRQQSLELNKVNPERPKAAIQATSAQPRPVSQKVGPPETPMRVYTKAEVEELLAPLPLESQEKLRRLIEAEGVEAKNAGTRTS